MAAVIMISVVASGCADDDGVTTTLDNATALERYCAVLDGATTRGSEETMAMLNEVALPEIASLLERMERGESSGDDPLELGTFNEATCGVRFP